MITYLARERQNVFVEVEELETYIYFFYIYFSSTGVIGVLAWSVCDREERRKFVAMKTRKTTLVANMKQYVLMRALQEEEYQELQEPMEYMSERHKKPTSTMERKQKYIVDEERKQAMKEFLTETRRRKVEGWRDTVAAECGFTQKQAAGSQSSEAEGDLSVSEVGVHRKDTEEGQKSCGQGGRSTQRVGGDAGLCVPTPADEPL